MSTRKPRRFKLSSSQITAIFVGYTLVAAVTFAIILTPSSTLLPAIFGTLLAGGLAYYLIQSNPRVAFRISQSKVSTIGILQEGDKIQLVLNFLEELFQNKIAKYERASIGYSEETVSMTLYDQDSVVLSLRADQVTGFLRLEVRQREKFGYGPIMKAMEAFEKSADRTRVHVRWLRPAFTAGEQRTLAN